MISLNQQDALDILRKCLLSENVMLFTGAGFSIGAKNGNGMELPSGKKLKSMLIKDMLDLSEDDDDYKELDEEKLPEVIEYCKSKRSPNEVQDYLTELFSNCQGEDYHKTVASFPWTKIYTTNIDDLFENSAPAGSLKVQNMKRLQSGRFSKNKTEYFKLHGCVKNPSEGYIFSAEDYESELISSDNSLTTSYSLDIQTNCFVFIGFDNNETDLNVYLKQYSWRNGARPSTRLFFVNPNPTLVFRNKAEKLNATIIEQTTEQFAKFLDSVTSHKGPLTNKKDKLIPGFCLINSKVEKLIRGNTYKSRLLAGEFPQWADYCFDWDIKHPIIGDILKNIRMVTNRDRSAHIVVSLFGSIMNGKSVYLRRIGYELIRDDFSVYENSDRDFSFDTFLDKASRSPEKKFALLVDNATFFYPMIAKLVEDFPVEKQLVVVTAGRSYFHRKKKYALRNIDYFYDFKIEPFDNKIRVDFAKEIIKTLKEKGMLGFLRNKDEEAMIKDILKVGDVCGLLYNLTDSPAYKTNYISGFEKELKTNHLLSKHKDVILMLAIFQTLDIPSFPLEILAIWKKQYFSGTLEAIQNYIRYIDADSIALRNNFLVNIIHKSLDNETKRKTISTVLKLIAPMRPPYGRDMWSMMQEKLMSYRTLSRNFNFSINDVEKLYDEIMPYYDNDYNYWIQVGIVDQDREDYIAAHNHLQQAERLNDHSYLVRHAIARNYLIRATKTTDKSEAAQLFSQGRTIMLRLIEDREADQTRAYSIHSYVIHAIKYWTKFKIVPEQKIVDSMVDLLKSLHRNNQDDLKTADAEQKLFKFIRRNNIGATGFTLNWDDLAILRNTYAEEGIDPDSFIEDDIPE